MQGISFSVPVGQTLGLLGPNGAGKTTTIAMIAGLLKPDGGAVRIQGLTLAGDTHAGKREIGIAPQEISLFEELPAQANLELFAALYGLTDAAAAGRIRHVLDFTGLTDRANSRVAGFSGGMKRRLNLAAAMVHDPALILLNEPTTGVDPQSGNALFENFAELQAQGKTIVYTTHYMEEAERLCDRIIIIDHGRIIADDTLAELYRHLPAAEKLTFELSGGSPAPDLEALNRMTPVKQAVCESGRLSVWLADLSSGTPVLLQALEAQGVRYGHFRPDAPSLESVFLTVTGRHLRDE